MNDKIYTVEQISNLTKPIFEKCSFVDKAFLFGSYAKNEAIEDSDIDIVVVLNKPKELDFYRLYPMLEEVTNKKIDIYCSKELDEFFLNHVKKDFKEIYVR